MGPGASAVGSLLNTLLTIIRPVQFEQATIQLAQEDVDRSRSLRVLATILQTGLGRSGIFSANEAKLVE
jgi:hypothetical protein